VYRLFAIDTLAEAGAGARAAIPALKRALNDNELEVREHAAEALMRIESALVK